MISTLFAAGLLLLPSANAFFRLPCGQPVLNARVDPIISPGVPSGHSHTIMGSNAIGFSSTFESLRSETECSTCMVKDDKSAYWVPELFYEHKNGSFEAVPHGGMLVYYLQRFAQGETVEAFPDGLRMFTGNPYARSDPGTDESKAISWLCIDFNGPAVPQTAGFTNTHCPDGLRAQVFFPSCWDGVNLDSPDHKSHMAYPDGIDNGRCPSTHPHHLVSIFYEVWFQPKTFNAENDGGRFVLSNGDPTGYGLHGDFMNGWDRSVLSRAVATCTAESGDINDCGVFKNEGRFYTNDVMNQCAAKNPLPNEKVDPGNLLRNLPGCVAVTEGPAPATAKDLVPGCVIGGGNGSAVPISGMNSSAPASSSAPSSPSSMPAGTAATSMPLASPSDTPATDDRPGPAATASLTSHMSPSPSSPPASLSDTPATNDRPGPAATASLTSRMSPSPSSPPATANQLAATDINTFTTDPAAVSSIIQGASAVSTPAASMASAASAMSPSPSAGDDGDQSGDHCGSANHRRRDNTLSAHRRSRKQRRHGSRRSN